MSKKQIIFLLPILFLLAAIYWFKRSDFISNRVETVVKENLEPILQQQVKIGKSQIDFFPPSAVITGISSSGKLPISIKKVQISFSLWSLITQSFFIQEIQIENPVVSFGPDVKLHLSSKKNKVVIRQILIKEGSVTYRADQNEFSIPHLNATIAPNFDMDRFNISLSGKQGRVIFGKQEKRLDRLEGAFLVHSGGIDITRATAQLDKTEIAGAGTLSFAGMKTPTGPSDISLNMRMTATVPLEEVLPVNDARPNLSGKMMLQGLVVGTVQDPTVTGKISIPHLVSEGGDLGSIGSDFSYKNKNGSFKNIVAKIFSGEGRGEAAFSEKGWYDLRFRYNHFSVDQALTAFLENSAGHFYGLFSKGEISLSGKGIRQDDITGAGTVEIIREAKAIGLVPSAKGIRDPIRLLSLITSGKLDFTKSVDGIRIHEGTLYVPDGKATLAGLYNPSEGLSLDTSLEMEEIKAATDLLQIPMTGKIHFSGTLSGPPQSPSVTGKIKLDHWTFDQHPLGAFQTQLDYHDKTMTLREGSLKGLDSPDLKQGDSLYKFGGALQFTQSKDSPVYDFIADAISVDPQEILTFFKQKIPLFATATGKFSIKGIGKKFRVEGPVTMGEGSLYGERFTKGQVALAIDDTSLRFSNIFMEKGGTDGVKKMTLEGNGEISYHGDYVIDVKTSQLPLQQIDLLRPLQRAEALPPLLVAPPNLFGEVILTVSGKGRFENPELTAQATLQNFRYKEVSLEAGTIHVNWQGENVTVLSSFPKKDFSLTAEIGAKKPYPFIFKAHSASLPIHPFFSGKWRRTSAFSGLSLYAGGDLSGKGTIETIKETDLTGALSILSATWGDYWLTNDGPITFVAQKGDFLIENGYFKGINTELTLSGRVAPFRNFGLIVKGSADMNLLRLFTPKIRSGKGVAQIDIRITDQWETPNIQGVLSMQSGRLTVANFSDPIFISALSLVFNRNILILETVSGKIGRGQFVGFGKATIKGIDLTSFGFEFNLKEMPIRLTSDLETIMEGTLVFQGDKSAQLLDGSLHVQKALYEKRIDLREMIVKWQESQEERLPINIPFAGTTRLAIHLSGKEAIAVRNNIANVPLEVDLFLKGTLENPLLFGQIDIPRGSFFFRDNKFKLTSGMVQFVNPEKIDPLFDIRGQSTVKDVAIDLSLTGTLSRFVLGLSSLPQLPDADILSLLTLRRKATEVADSGIVTTSIVSDFITSFLAEPIRELTGLDRISVGVPDGKTSKSTLFSFEKKVLNDNLLVVYSTTFDPLEQPKIQVFYDLGKNTALVGEKDEKGQLGGDLRFRFEFR